MSSLSETAAMESSDATPTLHDDPSNITTPEPATVALITNSLDSLRIMQQNILKPCRIRGRPYSLTRITYSAHAEVLGQYGNLVASWEREVTARDEELACLRVKNATQDAELQTLHQEFKNLQAEHCKLELKWQKTSHANSKMELQMNALQIVNKELKSQSFKDIPETMNPLVLKRFKESVKIGVLEDANSMLKGELQTNAERIKKLKGRICEKDKYISKLEQETKAIKAICVNNYKRMQTMEEENEILKQKTNSLNSNIQSLKEQSLQTEQESSTLKDQLSITNRELEACVRKCKSTEEHVEELKRNLTDREETIEELRLNCEKIALELQKEREKLEEVELKSAVSSSNLDSLIETSSRTITELKHQLDEKKVGLQKAKAKHSELIRGRKYLNKKNRKLNVEIEDLSKQIGKLKEIVDLTKAEKDQEMLELQQKFNLQIDNLQEQNRKLKELMDSTSTKRDQEIAKLRKELENQEHSKHQLKSNVEGLNGELRHQVTINRNYKKEIESYEQKLKTLTHDVTKQENLNQEQMKKIDSLAKELEALIPQTNGLKDDNQIYETKIRLQEEEIEKLRANYEKLEAETKDLKSELTNKISHITQLRHEHNTKLQILDSEHADCRKKLEEAKSKNIDMSHSLYRINQRIPEIQNRQFKVEQQLEGALNLLNEELKFRVQTIEDKDKEISDKENQLVALRRELEEIKQGFEAKKIELVRKCQELVYCSQQVFT